MPSSSAAEILDELIAELGAGNGPVERSSKNTTVPSCEETIQTARSARSPTELERSEEVARIAALKKYPEPMRTLLEVRGRRDDSDLAAYTGALQASRDAPDAKLIRQLVAELGDGSLQPKSILEDLFLGMPHMSLYDRDNAKKWEARWTADTKNVAQRYLLNSLNAADKEMEFTDALRVLLCSLGGGKVYLELDDRHRVDFSASVDGGWSTDTSLGEKLKEGISATQQYLLEHYPQLKGP